MKMTLFQKIFGSILIIFGLNGFFHFLPLPEKQGFALEFLQTLGQAKYLMPAVGIIMTAAGLFLVLNRWVTLGLLMLLPVSFNIFAFHLFHDIQGVAVAWFIWFGNIFLIKNNFSKIKPIFS